MLVTYLGHATVLIEQDGACILTDPIFSEKIFFLKRRSRLPLRPDTLPPLEAILISHAHYDHLDLPSFKFFSHRTSIVVPVGLGRWLGKFLKNPVSELPHGESLRISEDLTISAFPVTHRGFRLLPFRFNRCNGYLIEWRGQRVFFPGDTAYRSDFKEVCAERIDLALLPISCYKPEWFMRTRHMNPEEAVRTFEEIQARYMIPIHWGTFRLSTEPWHEPIAWLQRLAKEKGLGERVKILNPGESMTLAPLKVVEPPQKDVVRRATFPPSLR